MSIGGIEKIAYVLAVSANSNITLHEYNIGQWKANKTRSWHEVRVSMSQVFWIASPIVLLIAAAYQAKKHFYR